MMDSSWLKGKARELGFDDCRITTADPSEQAVFFQQWLAEGKAGEMEWMARQPERRMDPRQVLPGARSIIMVAMNYYQAPANSRGQVARYAMGEDYHEVLQQKLKDLARFIEASGGNSKVYVDTGAILEKPLAERAGLGWQGKSTMLINERLGTWFFLGEILTTLELESDSAAKDRCGSCHRCIDACPTGAITAPYQLDARRCIAYLTIELKGAIPEELRPLIGNHVYGCDDCLEACPWNRWAQETREASFHSKGDWNWREMLRFTPQEFNRRFKGSPIQRVKRRGLLRNICVVLGNIGTADDLEALREAMQHEEPLVREHAAWAVQQIEKRLEKSKEENS